MIFNTVSVVNGVIVLVSVGVILLHESGTTDVSKEILNAAYASWIVSSMVHWTIMYFQRKLKA